MTGPSGLPRRALLRLGAGALTLPWLPRLALAAAAGDVGSATVRPRVRPFALADVRLGPGPVRDALEINRRSLLALDPDRLLHMFRLTAALPSSAEPLGGWEAPDNELRGHFTGHYLSACALLAAQTGDEQVRRRGLALVDALAECQAAHGNGYLSAFPEELFDRLRAGQRVWAPFYTLHKLMAGLLDTHALSDSPRALQVLTGLARWTEAWVQPLGEAHLARILEREYGGMNEVLYALAATTGESRWLDLARRFDHERLYAPLAAGRDELEGLHVNTTVPKIVGAARGYELTGERRLREVADYFWHTVTERRCYCTGGTSNNESWNAPPGVLARELSGYTQECCVTYNLHKLTRHLFAWTGDPRAADYYERAYYNGILGVQHPADGSKLYYVALQGGYWKMFGTPLHDFWCCTGSMAEAFAKLGDSIYFQDETGVYINLYVASTLNWADGALRLVQETRFPEETAARFTVHAPRPRRAALRFRVPSWARGGRASLNGTRLDGFAAPGGYFTLERTWRDGDRVEIELPMALYAAPMPDDPTLVAVMYGPLVLAARLGAAGLTPELLRAVPTAPRQVPEYRAPPAEVAPIVGAADRVSDWVRPIEGRTLEFTTTGQARDLRLAPLYRIFDERYAVYLRTVAGA